MVLVTQVNNVDWRVSAILATSSTAVVDAPVVSVRLDITRPEEAKPSPVVFEASKDKFDVLLSELKAARAMMGELEGE